MKKQPKHSAAPPIDPNKLRHDKLEEAYQQVSDVILGLVTPLSASVDPADDINWLEGLLWREPEVIDLIHLRQKIREAQESLKNGR